ncbi:MAG TPA: ArsA-related P-loop ATPase [Candidatus Thermoplasmatota archaeon]|nr:ArsA-related P-loop ATPase [Candidatus Thermoplasmatota archaeon]
MDARDRGASRRGRAKPGGDRLKLADQILARKLVVFLGPGGVGKTTLAAAAALEAARRGRKTLVFTIDPARRLADAMGVKLGNEPSNVKPNLDAMMLDTKAALDGLVARHAPSPETMKRMLASRFYAQLSDAFAGSEEYVAMGALHDVVKEGGYDLVVVDTPPSRHAVDFLRVNEKLIRVFESGVVKYLFRPTRVLRMGGGYVAGTLAKWTSAGYLDEVSDFLTTLDPMFVAMEERVRRMQGVLRDPTTTSINLVATAEAASVPLALDLAREVERDARLEVAGVVVNRFYPRLPGLADARMLVSDGAAATALARATGASASDAAAFLEDAAVAATLYDAVAREHERRVEELRAGIRASFALVPAHAGSIHDLDGLEKVRARLFA